MAIDMRCPVDGSTLVASDRRGIRIDFCPMCRGVWLSSREVGKLLERANEIERPARPEGRGVANGNVHPLPSGAVAERPRRPTHLLDDVFDLRS